MPPSHPNDAFVTGPGVDRHTQTGYEIIKSYKRISQVKEMPKKENNASRGRAKSG